MDYVNYSNNRRRSELFKTDDDDDDDVHRSPTIADTLDLAVRRPASAVHVRPLERLRGRWTFRSMPQDVNLAAYGKQFAGEWPSFRVGPSERATETPDTSTVDAADEETPDSGGVVRPCRANGNSPAPNTFAGQCVAYAARAFSWDFYRTVCMYFLPTFTFRNRR